MLKTVIHFVAAVIQQVLRQQHLTVDMHYMGVEPPSFGQVKPFVAEQPPDEFGAIDLAGIDQVVVVVEFNTVPEGFYGRLAKGAEQGRIRQSRMFQAAPAGTPALKINVQVLKFDPVEVAFEFFLVRHSMGDFPDSAVIYYHSHMAVKTPVFGNGDHVAEHSASAPECQISDGHLAVREIPAAIRLIRKTAVSKERRGDKSCNQAGEGFFTHST